MASVIFNYLVLVMWRFKVGNIYADQLKGRTPRMRLGDVLAGAGTPGAGTGQLTIGDPGVLQALTPDSLSAIAERKARLREHLETGGKKKKYNGLLVVHAHGSEETLDTIDEVLQEFAETHKMAEVTAGPDETSTFEYLLGLPKDIEPSELIATMRQKAGEKIIAAEYRSLSGKKDAGKSKPRRPHWTLPREGS